jgi:hypothetical protein
LRQKLPLVTTIELPEEEPAEAAALVLEKKDRQSVQGEDSNRPTTPPPVFRGQHLVVTREQHAKWLARWPDADDLASWYSIVDRECAEQGILNGEVLGFAEDRLGDMSEIPF